MILLTYGTRPEFIKIKPLINKMSCENIPFKTLFTGQHKDLINEFDYEIIQTYNGKNRLDNIIHNCLNTPDNVLENINYILVQGDTTSVLGLSIMAMHRKIKIIHLEAGLRSYDLCNPYPEEYNRIIVSKLANIHLCPTENNRLNLLKENINDDSIYVVGNTGLDNLVNLKDKCEYSNKILITLHRRENQDILTDWFNAINNLSELYLDHEFILPIHPNPIIREKLPNNVKFTVIEPLKHNELLELLIKCKLVITDSGGLQEEGSFLNKKVIVCRKATERTESLGIHSFLCQEPNLLKDIFDKLINNYIINEKCPYGDGFSADKIVDIIKTYNL